ncbi:sucrose transport protein SUC3 isoform X1 [Salvia miltiorrhiza]|uniref:sucrose transport protein SUC3 isoform X1 n=2 Tax=Salvia miltiorrhiza TaxID=226208 RepID=UPI0025ABC5F0|nr:sucrose transport protein SUC3 isoform X1 [Salvia miltiorrhiza]
MDAVSIRVPYRNLKQEVELVRADDWEHRQIHNSSSPSDTGDSPQDTDQHIPPPNNCSLLTLILSCTVAAGVQFGWALQLSLLTPYVQTLGIGHEFSSFIWLCGPITGLMVQPCVGIWSDKCSSKYGRRRPFIFVGSLMISVAVVIIGYSADIGYMLGDTKEHCSTFKGTRTRAAFIFVIGFWMLDLANNTVQGPARALLADLSGPDQRNSANAIFCSWMAVGNILGFSAGSSGNWHRWFPFLTSRACCEPCANLKAAFLVAVVFLTLCTLVTLYFAKEVPLTHIQHHLSDSAPLLDDHQINGSDLSKSRVDSESNHHTLENKSEKHYTTGDGGEQKDQNNNEDTFSDSPGAVLVNLLTSLRHLPPAMHSVLIVMALTWLSWFPFFLFDTDWMGREVFHGDPKGELDDVEAYNQGVREGAFGLLLNSVVLGICSFFIDPMCQWLGARVVWAISNFIVFVCMAGTALISLVSLRQYSDGVQHVIGANETTKIASLVVFAILGIPLAITYSVPFSVTAELTADSGGGQGLAIGVLNLAIVIPQMIVSLGAGPWDALFGGGNIPAFVLASLSALAAGVIAVHKLPNLSSNFKSTGFHFG